MKRTAKRGDLRQQSPSPRRKYLSGQIDRDRRGEPSYTFAGERMEHGPRVHAPQNKSHDRDSGSGAGREREIGIPPALARGGGNGFRRIDRLRRAVHLFPSAGVSARREACASALKAPLEASDAARMIAIFFRSPAIIRHGPKIRRKVGISLRSTTKTVGRGSFQSRIRSRRPVKKY